MTTLQDRIVDHLAGSFISGATIDPDVLARRMQTQFPGVELDELARAIRLVATGIGMRIKETSHEPVLAEAASCSCI